MTQFPTPSHTQFNSGQLPPSRTHPPGKAASAAAPHNRTHGLLAQSIILPGESIDRFNQLLNGLLDEHQPQTKSQREVVITMAVARWRQMRTWAIQKYDLSREMTKYPNLHPGLACAISLRTLGGDPGHSIANTLRYETAFERQFNRALRELQNPKRQPHHHDGDDACSAAFASSAWDADATMPHR